MPELKSVYGLIKAFTAQYDSWALKIQKEPKSTDDFWFNTDSGSICIKSINNQILCEMVICITTVNINTEYQNKGVFSSFIKYIQKNPYSFSKIEIENIQSEYFLDSFIRKGFKSTTDLKHIEFEPLKLFKNLK